MSCRCCKETASFLIECQATSFRFSEVPLVLTCRHLSSRQRHISIFTAAHTSLAAETAYSRFWVHADDPGGGADCTIGSLQLNRTLEACPDDSIVASQCRQN